MGRHSVYSYAFNNPIRFIDPDGMMPEDQSDQHTDQMAASAATDDTDGEGDDNEKDKDELWRETYEVDGITYVDIYYRGELSTDSRHNSVEGAGGFGEGQLGSLFEQNPKKSKFHNTLASLPIAGGLSLADGPIPVGEIAGLALIATAVYEDFRVWRAQRGKKNIWPDQYGYPPNVKDVDWSLGDGELADQIANENEDLERGQGSPHGLAKKWYRDKRPK